MESANDQTAPIANRCPLATTSRGASGEGHGARLGGEDAGLCFAAAIFDMDGVVTDTAAAHADAWKQTFDGFLKAREHALGEPFIEFTRGGDYLAMWTAGPATTASRHSSIPEGSSSAGYAE